MNHFIFFVQIKTVVGVSKDIEQWNCNQDMVKNLKNKNF